MNIQELDNLNSNKLLERLDEWRLGICPDGNLAKESCFVLNKRPTISIHPDQTISSLPEQQKYMTTELITEKTWSNNLVEHGVLFNLNDDSMIKILSEFYMIFHNEDKINHNYNTLHSIQLFKHASFKINDISRPTRRLQIQLDKFIKEKDLTVKWNYLTTIWNTFGYLWPRKIILGYKHYFKETYKFIDSVDSMNGYYYNLNKLKEKQKKDPSEFHLESFLNKAVIVARIDMSPIHDYFTKEIKGIIHDMIKSKFIQIPVYRPIKIYNISTNSYLCWDPYGNSQKDPSFDGENHDYLVRAVSADKNELLKSPESQYIWRFTWTPIDTTTTTNYYRQSHTIRGCNKVYIYPACKSISPMTKYKLISSPQQPWHINDRLTDTTNLVDTHKMVLSCRPYKYESTINLPQQSEFSKLRALRLLSSQYKNEKIDWTIEYPDNGLKYMTDAQVNIKLNFHEHIRRMKPLLIGDIIQLQQIGLLTAFPPIPSDQTKKTVRNSKCKKKNVLCVDEDITIESWRENTFWRIELATQDDINQHSSNYIRWQQQQNNTVFDDLILSQQQQQQEDTVSFTSHVSSLRRTRSLGSLHENISIHTRDDSEKAHYFEDLMNIKSTSKILSQIAKVSLQPLAQLVKPSKSKQQQKHLVPPPPPF